MSTDDTKKEIIYAFLFKTFSLNVVGEVVVWYSYILTEGTSDTRETKMLMYMP